MDGVGPLSYEKAAQRQYGDEFACIGLQFDQSDEHPGHQEAHSSDTGVVRLFVGLASRRS